MTMFTRCGGCEMLVGSDILDHQCDPDVLERKLEAARRTCEAAGLLVLADNDELTYRMAEVIRQAYCQRPLSDLESEIRDLLTQWFAEDVTFVNREYVAENLAIDILTVIEDHDRADHTHDGVRADKAIRPRGAS